MTTISNFSEELAALVARASSSVFRVHGGRRPSVSALAWTEALLLTAAHGLTQESNVELSQGDERRVATLVGWDPASDLAVLRVDGGLAPLARARPEQVRLAQPVIGLARPGQSARASAGILSVVGSSLRLPDGSRIERYVESDIRVGPGFSGGPLLDTQGELLGMNTLGLVRDTPCVLTLASLEPLVASLIAHGSVRRAYLGIATQSVRLPENVASERQQTSGLMVLSLQKGAPADAAGLLLGDVLLSLDAVPLERVGDLQATLDESRIARACALEVWRAGELKPLSIEPRARGAAR
jgi:serine protease DegQ